MIFLSIAVKYIKFRKAKKFRINSKVKLVLFNSSILTILACLSISSKSVKLKISDFFFNGGISDLTELKDFDR